MTSANREYRDRLFTFIFGNDQHRKWTLELYNAINGTNYDDPDSISITTIREVLYLGMHNDVSFLLADDMNLYEQQSTYNPNMPLRMLQYAAVCMNATSKSDGLTSMAARSSRSPCPKSSSSTTTRKISPSNPYSS